MLSIFGKSRVLPKVTSEPFVIKVHAFFVLACFTREHIYLLARHILLAALSAEFSKL